MGAQYLRWLRCSGTKLFGRIVDNSVPGNQASGGGRWGLDGVVDWSLTRQASGYVLSSFGKGSVQMSGSSEGNLCLDGGQPIGGHNRPGEIGVANGDGTIDFSIDLSSLPGPMMSYAAQPGDTLNFQVWFRDIDPNGSPTSNFTDAVSVTFDCRRSGSQPSKANACKLSYSALATAHDPDPSDSPWHSFDPS